MLSKLIKYEWKETWKIPTLILSVTLLLSLALGWYFSLQPAPAPDVEINVGNMVLFCSYAFLLSATSLLLLLYLGSRFYKNLYTDEGYLMHTLPVKPWMHLASKTFIGSIWVYLAGIFTILTVFPVTLLALPKIAFISPEETDNIFSALVALLGNSSLKLLFFVVPYMLLSAVSSILLLYAAISLGQFFGRHKVFGSVLCYLGLNMLVSGLSSFFTLPITTGMILTQSTDPGQFLSVTMPNLMTSVYLLSFVLYLLVSAGAFFLCHYVMSKCLNLD